MGSNKILKPSSYYDKGGISVFDIWKAKMTKEEFRGALKANCIKYLLRAGLKEESNELDDLIKCRVYLDLFIEEIKNGNM